MLKESFLRYLQFEKNYSDKTIVSYGTDLSEFEAYFKAVDEALDFTAVDSDIIRGWMVSLMDEGYSASSVNRKLSALRSFLSLSVAGECGFGRSDPEGSGAEKEETASRICKRS